MNEKLEILILLFYEEKEVSIHNICKQIKYCIKYSISLGKYKIIREKNLFNKMQ
jgi:hypothetical protein